MPDRRRGAAPAWLVLVVVLLTAACGGPADRPGAQAGGGDAGGLTGVTLDQPYRPAPVRLTDTGGAPYSLLEDTDAPLTLVFFGYTNCPDICRLVMSTLAAAELRLPEDRRDDVDVVLVTTDPARDTPEVLRAYLDRFDPTFVGATGALRDVKRLARSMAVHIGPGGRLPSGGYEVEHNDHVLAVTPDDRVHTLWMRDVSAAALADDLATLLERQT